MRVPSFSACRLLVVGDVILDRYLFGDVARISPEAPVPVLRGARLDSRLGGAANVVANLIALGARAELLGVVGADERGRELRGLLEAIGAESRGLLSAGSRPTTTKTRVVARQQQVLRIDEEDDAPIEDPLKEALLGALEQSFLATPPLAGVVVSDYAKGLLDARLLAPLLERARRAGVPVVADPKRRELSIYTPSRVLTPNERELGLALGRDLAGDAEVVEGAREALGRFGLEALLVTRGAAGMLLVERGAEPIAIAARAREVFDVTGAGDTVSAVLAASLAAGASLPDAARLANEAAAIAVARVGTAAVTRAELESFAGG